MISSVMHLTFLLAFCLSLMSCHLFGTGCFPPSDVSRILNQPTPDSRCQVTNSKQETTLDFFTNHPISTSSTVASHQVGQQRHTPLPFCEMLLDPDLIIQRFEVELVDPEKITAQRRKYQSVLYRSRYIARLFRPPWLL